MPLLSFRVGPVKALRLAQVDSVPRVMIIAGPNGVGKSTLLFEIKNARGTTASGNVQYLYQGPHRVLRRTSVRRGWLSGVAKSFADLLRSAGDVSGFEGMNFPNSDRTPDNVDEAGSTIKYTLGQLENRRQSKIAGMYDRAREAKADIKSTDVPDIYEPLRLLTKHLLPHLEFSRIDFANEENIRCLWRRKDDATNSELDIDQLSSGEKAIVILFIPLLEGQIVERLDDIDRISQVKEETKSEEEKIERVMLIDEPEQHLHPDLQSKLLSYIRALTIDTSTQFIMATHSPTILDQAFDDELFVVYAPKEIPNKDGEEEENQLRRVATSTEKLEALKGLTGSAYFLTTGRIIVCIEGVPNEDASDIGLFEILYPRSTSFTLVPTTGKGNVINTVTKLREHVAEDVFRIRVRGLVDADSSDSLPEGVAALPVCMIENLLLDWSCIAAFGQDKEIDPISDVEKVEAAFAKIVSRRRDDEIALRVQRKLKAYTVRIGGTSLAEVKRNHQAEQQKVEKLLPSDDVVERIISEVAAQVDEILQQGTAKDRFHGKRMLREFYSGYVQATNISYGQMCIQIAQHIAKMGTVGARLDPIFDGLAS